MVCKRRRRCTLLLDQHQGLQARRRRATAMDQRTTSGSLTSSPTWEGLHEWLRNAIQALIQAALEAEVTELLGRVRYQRRAAVDAPAGYRNGYGKPRKLTTPHGHHHPAPPPGAGSRGAVREPDAPVRPAHEGGLGPVARAVPARAGRGGLRPGPAGRSSSDSASKDTGRVEERRVERWRRTTSRISRLMAAVRTGMRVGPFAQRHQGHGKLPIRIQVQEVYHLSVHETQHHPGTDAVGRGGGQDPAQHGARVPVDVPVGAGTVLPRVALPHAGEDQHRGRAGDFFVVRGAAQQEPAVALPQSVQGMQPLREVVHTHGQGDELRAHGTHLHRVQGARARSCGRPPLSRAPAGCAGCRRHSRAGPPAWAGPAALFLRPRRSPRPGRGWTARGPAESAWWPRGRPKAAVCPSPPPGGFPSGRPPRLGESAPAADGSVVRTRGALAFQDRVWVQQYGYELDSG